MRILINGIGVAGPTLAWWLRKGGHTVTLVEEAPELRRAGYIIDFWGLGYDIADKMGLIPGIRAKGYQLREVRIVDRHGRPSGGFSAEVFAQLTNDRYTSVRRSDLAAAIFHALDREVETMFGDSVASLDPTARGVRVGFTHAPPREVDLVVGADGLHSRVRRLAFGPQAQFETSLGYHVAAFELEGYRPRDPLIYLSHSAPGRQVARFSMRDDTTLFLLVFRDQYLPAGALTTEQGRKAAVAAAFADVEWECPAILSAMQKGGDIYFDRVSQIRMGQWASGRTALVGDAAACVSLLAGEGTGLAMTEAYVLAGELNTCGDDYAAAFQRYQGRLRPLLKQKQAAAAKFASSFAPASAFGITVRNLATSLLRVPFLAEFLMGRSLRDDFTLPDYGG